MGRLMIKANEADEYLHLLDQLGAVAGERGPV